MVKERKEKEREETRWDDRFVGKLSSDTNLVFSLRINENKSPCGATTDGICLSINNSRQIKRMIKQERKREREPLQSSS